MKRTEKSARFQVTMITYNSLDFAFNFIQLCKSTHSLFTVDENTTTASLNKSLKYLHSLSLRLRNKYCKTHLRVLFEVALNKDSFRYKTKGTMSLMRNRSPRFK